MQAKEHYQLNARLPLETKEQFEKIIEYYRSTIQIGKVSQSDVIQDLIKKSYEQLEKNGKLKSNK